MLPSMVSVNLLVSQSFLQKKMNEGKKERKKERVDDNRILYNRQRMRVQSRSDPGTQRFIFLESIDGCKQFMSQEEKSEMAESLASVSPTQMGLSISPPTTASTSSASSSFSLSPKKEKLGTSLEIRAPTASATTPAAFKSLVSQLATSSATSTQSSSPIFTPQSQAVQAQTLAAQQSQHILQSQYTGYPTSAPHHAISEPALALDLNGFLSFE